MLNSVFFPTDYPGEENVSVGLLSSQQDVLTTLVAGYTKYLEYDPDAKLSLAAYTDERGPDKYNQSLSERRAESVKQFLVTKGVPEDRIETSAYGKDQQLGPGTVADLQANNPTPPPETHLKDERVSVFAYNRRVDIVLHPSNQESQRFYPNGSPDADILWQRLKPDLTSVQQDH